ncbi:rodlin [Streptomyces sp. NPDC049040]|uniref:rodlin n=1 Tax=Streptomyces sp. NPDC049040 TaxID=3365593 RepID=UPI00371CF429
MRIRTAFAALGLAATANASAIGNDDDVNTANGNNASQVFGNQKSQEAVSPQFGTVQSSIDKPCVGLPAKVDAQSLIGLVNVGGQDVNASNNPQDQQCAEKSAQARGD